MKESEASVFSGTFSILAISPDFKLMGVAVASGSPSVGNRVPHAKPGVGVVATQAYTNVIYGLKGLELMTQGLSPQQTLDELLREDSNSELRQVAIMDFKGRAAVFTGALVSKHHAEFVGRNCVAVGNMLSKREVISRMAEKFENTTGDLALRLADALAVGSESGGDRRGEISAALTVVSSEKTIIKIKVDMHANPVRELRNKLKLQS
jgi:uncharacterized Ntn-hydrolase superfamily protein